MDVKRRRKRPQCGACKKLGHYRTSCGRNQAAAEFLVEEPGWAAPAQLAYLDEPIPEVQIITAENAGDPPPIEECLRRLNALGPFGIGSMAAEAGNKGLPNGHAPTRADTERRRNQKPPRTQNPGYRVFWPRKNGAA